MKVSSKIHLDKTLVDRKMNSGTKQAYEKIDRRATAVFRAALIETLAKNNATAPSVGAFKSLKTERRELKHRKAGSGLSYRVADGEHVSRIIVTEKALGLDYWPVMVAQYGRKRLPYKFKEKGEGTYVLPVLDGKKAYKPRQPNRKSVSGNYTAAWTQGPIEAVAPSYNWMGEAKELAAQRMEAEVDKIVKRIKVK